MTNHWRVTDLTALGVLRLSGPETVRFLQGQLSNDVERVGPQTSVLAGYHNPQGRAIALLRLVHASANDLLAVLPRELVADVTTRLRKFVLRSKVTLTDASADWRVRGLMGVDGSHNVDAARSSAATNQAPLATPAGHGPAAGTPPLPQTHGSQTLVQSSIVVRVDDTSARWLVLSPNNTSDPFESIANAERSLWQTLDIEHGIPQIYAATTEAFVAQMLNLDALDAISFNKGCYTGQEVIARAHYRGRVKRRMQRFRTTSPVTLSPGDSGQLSDGRSYKVVEAVTRADGRCEFLAVAPLSAADDEATGTASTDSSLAVEPLPLPYALPE